MAWVGLGSLVVLEVRMAVVEGCEVPKQPFHQSDLFEIGLVLVMMVVVDPFYKKKGKHLLFKNEIQATNF